MIRSCSISYLTTVLFRMLFVFCRRNVCEREYDRVNMTCPKSLRKMCSIHQMKLLFAIMQRLRLHQWPCQHGMSKKSAQNVQHLQIETSTGDSTFKCSWYASCVSQRTIMKKRFQRHLGSSDDHWSRYLRTLGVGLSLPQPWRHHG